MKKQYILLACYLIFALPGFAQNKKIAYPEPEFSNEVTLLEIDSVFTIRRLEKNSSKMESKTKAGGFGGYEAGYFAEGERSPVRIHGGNLSFIFSTGASSQSNNGNTEKDSMMLANGIDPSGTQGMGSMMPNDPSNINLYKADGGKGKRKVVTMKGPGTFSFGAKQKTASKITFSLKKIRQGYWEMVVDKPLTRGEYIFSMMNMGVGSADGSATLFCFGVD